MSTHAAHVAAAIERAEREMPLPSAPRLPPVDGPPDATPILDLAHALLAAAITVQRAGSELRARARIRHDGCAIQLLTLVDELLGADSEMTPREFAGSAALAIANALPIITAKDTAMAQRLGRLRRTLADASRSAPAVAHADG